MHALLITLLLQIQDPQPPSETRSQTEQSDPAARDRWVSEILFRQMEQAKQRSLKTMHEQQAEREAAFEEYMFVTRFNHLVGSLRKFIDGYNAGKVDAKSVKAVQKAWREIEKDGWFKPTDVKKAAAAAPQCEQPLVASEQ